MPWWIAILIGLAGVYFLVVVWFAWVSVHPPRIPAFCSPGMFGAPQEDVWIESSDSVVLFGWWVAHERAKGLVVLCHGYCMNRFELAPVAFRLWQEGYSCLLFDFRAHGRSSRSRCSIGWRERKDVDAAVRWARARAPGLPTALVGSSMGSAAAAFALASDPALADAVVLDSCYSRLNRAVPGWWRFVGGTILAILLAPVLPIAGAFARIRPKKVDVARALANIGGTPVLLLHGEADDLASPEEAKRNLAALPGGTQIVWFEGCGHCEFRWVQPERYWSELIGFLNSQLLRRKEPFPEA